MPNKINLLPDAIANQIAAGEVIQRPASIVKELMENSVDAGSKNIKLIVKNAGKTLVQVIDDGSGMNETDARMSFEKHATSKIKTIDDLFAIYTKGFRGEALASVAAVAQVEMKTRTVDTAVGTCIINEGTNIKSQEPCQTPVGTSIAVKNLFFNVPARRNFLKSDNVELRHIIDEFFRISLPHYNVGFSLFSNDSELYHLKAGNLRQRIVALFGDSYNEKLVPISEETDIVQIKGFIGKPEFARKTRGEQFIFVNDRFIKSSYLNHAVFSAYEDIIPSDRFPFFVLFLNIDPKRIDINVHPSKHEIKFDEERLIYTFVNAAARHGLAQHSVTPTLDFDQEDSFNQMGAFSQRNKDYDPEKSAMGFSQTDFPFTAKKRLEENEQSNLQNWQELYKIAKPNEDSYTVPSYKNEELIPEDKFSEEPAKSKPYQVHAKYIVSPIKSGFILIDQQAAHERILFENFLQSLEQKTHLSQKQLFPQSIEFNNSDANVLREILEEINSLGFDIQEFGNDSFVIHSLPADITVSNEKSMIEELIEQYKNNVGVVKLPKRESLARSLAQSSCIKHGKILSSLEMTALIDELFACENPYTAPNGRKTFIKYELKDLAKSFEG
jgi:DNA mismatch repair protein MutL